MVVRITTWNVNGIRNPFGYQPWRDGKTFEAMFDILETDIVIMQELKIQWKDLRDDMVIVPGWDCYFSLPRHKKGYSGVGIYTRNSTCAPIRAEEGLLGVLCASGSTTPYRDLPADQAIGGYPTIEQVAAADVDAAELDAEGRCIVLEFPAFVLFGIYSPANSSGLRDDFRLGFINALDSRVRNLMAAGKRVVVTGDLNVSRSELDTANATETLRKEGITHEEYISTPNRRIFNQLLEDAEVIGDRDEGRENSVLWDICRGFHPTRKGMYTHWEQKKNARPGNYGSRIDYILCSLEMKPWFCESNIQEGLMGSDHCPVYAIMKDVVDRNGEEVHLHDIMNPSGMFDSGKRIREYSLKDPCPLSGRLLTGLDKRRSIRDMFGNKPSFKPPTPMHPSLQETSSLTEGLSTSRYDQKPTQAAPKNISEESQSHLSSTNEQKLPLTEAVSLSTATPSQTPEKRRNLSSDARAPLSKRSKSSFSAGSSNAPAKNQKSLMNFFATKPSEPKNDELDSPKTESQGSDKLLTAEDPVEDPSSNINGEEEFQSLERDDSKRQNSSTNADSILRPTVPEDPPSPPLLVDPIVSKESWGRLFSKPSGPRCEGHSEPCQIMKTKKKGFNCGREFYMCARPLGPTGEKERNTQWRCGTFIWASDWNSKTESSV